MAKLSFELHKIQRQVEKLTGDRRQAAGLRKKIEARLQQLAANAAPQIIQNLLKSGRAGWVNDPDKGDAVLVERGTGCTLKDSSGHLVRGSRIKLQSKPSIDKAVFLQHLKDPNVENFAPYMYLDRAGNVTVGIGFLLRTANAAKKLPFFQRGTNIPASQTHIENAFNKVKNSGLAGEHAFKFKNLTHIEISEAEAEIRALDKMDEFLALLVKPIYFPDFETFPVEAKMGHLDLAYTRGVRGTKDDYKRFAAAVRRRNWKQAGVEQRDGRPPKRASMVQTWFDQAARKEPFFISHRSCEKALSKLLRP